MTRVSVSLAIATMVLIGALAGGCQEEQASSAGSASLSQDAKLHRLIALENKQFKAEIETLKNQISQQKQQLDQREQQKQQIAQCEQQKQQILAQLEQLKDKWLDEVEKGVKEECAQERETVQGTLELLTAITEENTKLTEEIEQLKAKLAELKGESAAEPQVVEP